MASPGPNMLIEVISVEWMVAMIVSLRADTFFMKHMTALDKTSNDVVAIPSTPKPNNI